MALRSGYMNDTQKTSKSEIHIIQSHIFTCKIFPNSFDHLRQTECLANKLHKILVILRLYVHSVSDACIHQLLNVKLSGDFKPRSYIIPNNIMCDWRCNTCRTTYLSTYVIPNLMLLSSARCRRCTCFAEDHGT